MNDMVCWICGSPPGRPGSASRVRRKKPSTSGSDTLSGVVVIGAISAFPGDSASDFEVR
jgi:hypothetical protein